MIKLVISLTLTVATISCLLLAIVVGVDSYKLFTVEAEEFSRKRYKITEVNYLEHEYVKEPTKVATGLLVDDPASNEYSLEAGELGLENDTFEAYLLKRDSVIEVLWHPDLQSVFKANTTSLNEWLSSRRKAIFRKLAYLLIIPFVTLLYWGYSRVSTVSRP